MRLHCLVMVVLLCHSVMLSNVIKTIPTIKNVMTGKNFGVISRWYDPSELKDLIAKADPGDLLEMDQGTFQHWTIYGGMRELDNGQKQACVVHFGKDTDRHIGFHPSSSSNLTINFNGLEDVVNTSRVRINNGLDRKYWFLCAKDISVINKRIRDFIQDSDSYNPLNRNCEQFAKYCRYGEKNSLQADDASRVINYLELSLLQVFLLLDNNVTPSLFMSTLSMIGGLKYIFDIWTFLLIGILLLILQLADFYHFGVNTGFSILHLTNFMLVTLSFLIVPDSTLYPLTFLLVILQRFFLFVWFKRLVRLFYRNFETYLCVVWLLHYVLTLCLPSPDSPGLEPAFIEGLMELHHPETGNVAGYPRPEDLAKTWILNISYANKDL